jgi:dephospho-CoA kinase
VLGLTGGIGAGKSTVAALFAAQCGATVIDTDRIARDVVEPDGPAFSAVVRRFGPGVRQADGHLDRARLAEVVFSDAVARADLEAIVHPAVEAVVRDRIAAERAAGTALVVLEVPLLVEAGWDRLVSTVVVVDCQDEIAVRRLVASRGMSAEDARRRLAAQASRAARLARADIVISNDGTVDDLSRQVAAIGLEGFRSATRRADR